MTGDVTQDLHPNGAAGGAVGREPLAAGHTVSRSQRLWRAETNDYVGATDRRGRRIAALSAREVMRAAERAARQLAPVVVAMGRDRPRLASFCDRIETIDGERCLILSPIAVTALPRVDLPATVSAVDAGWRLNASWVRALGHNAAYFSLDSAREAGASRRGGRARTVPSEPLTLLVPGSREDLDSHVFPIIDLGPRHCSIEAATPFAPGARLEPVEIFGARRVLRRASAVVLETIPWYGPEGARVFRCRLALSPATAAESASSVYDLVTEPERVRRVLGLASALRLRAIATVGPEQTVELQFSHLRDDALDFELSGSGSALPVGNIRVRFELFTLGYEMDVRVLAVEDHTMQAALPLVVRRRQWRREQRVHVAGATEAVKVRCYNAATASRIVRDVVDLSFGGLCFRVDAHEDVLWPDLPLERVELLRGSERIPLSDLVVRSIQKDGSTAVCHAALSSPGALDDTRYIDLLASLRHPELVGEDGDHFDDIVALHRDVHLFAPHMERNLEADAGAAARTWKLMHARAREACRTLIRIEDDRVVATVSAVRAYERAWTAQHMSASPTRQWHSPAALDLTYTEHIVPRTDAHFTVMWVKVGNKRQTEFLGRFLDLTGTGEAGACVRLQLWIRREAGAPEAGPAEPGLCVRPMRRSEEPLAARAAQRALGAIPAAALSLVPGQFTLPETTRLFARAGVQRTRRCHVVTRDGVAVMLVLDEFADPGINFTLVLGATWLIPIRPEQDEDGAATRAALAYVHAHRPATTAGDRFLLVLDGARPAPIEVSGYRLETPVDVYAYNRAGLQRWYDYVHERRGQMHARALQREEEPAPRDASAPRAGASCD